MKSLIYNKNIFKYLITISVTAISIKESLNGNCDTFQCNKSILHLEEDASILDFVLCTALG